MDFWLKDGENRHNAGIMDREKMRYRRWTEIGPKMPRKRTERDLMARSAVYIRKAQVYYALRRLSLRCLLQSGV